MILFGRTKLELKVGVFVFIGIIILLIFIFSIGKVRMWSSGYKVNFIFNFVNGVKTGAPVRFAGVDAGEVKEIKFFFVSEEQATKIELVIWIKKDVKIPLDSTIWVNTLGLLGEKYVEIIPGKDYAHCLAPNQDLAGIDPIPMHEVFRMGKGIVENLNKAITNKEGTVGKLLYDDSLYQNLEAFTDDIKKNPWKLLYRGKERK